jgi:hypothetical protein
MLSAMARWLAVALVVLAALSGGAAAQDAAPILMIISVDGLRPDYVTAADAHGLKIPALRRFLKKARSPRVCRA